MADGSGAPRQDDPGSGCTPQTQLVSVPEKDLADMARLAVQGRRIQDVLQSVEDALMDAGYEARGGFRSFENRRSKARSYQHANQALGVRRPGDEW
jgi:hypothetical protein